MATRQKKESRLDELNERLGERNRELVRQNLEAIVTSQTWDDIHDLPGRDGAEIPIKSGSDVSDTIAGRPMLDTVLDTDLDEPSGEQRAERLARRLRNH